MATQADIDALADKLRTTSPLLWIVKDCPVVALFKSNRTEDLDSLGQPLDRNGCGDLLRLWIGMNQDTRQLFVTLTIRIRVSPVRKKTRRQGRLMFLVVPSTSLQLRSSVVDYIDLDKQLSQCLFDMPSDTQSAKCELLQISIDLGPHVSDVIMPEYQCRSNVSPQAMALLRKLKSLSEASSFQLYTNQEASKQAAIEHVSNILLDGPSLITPSIDLQGFYPGGRSACKNMWSDQGWLEAEDSKLAGKESPVQSNQKESSNLFEPQPPPPYEPDIVPNHASTPTSADRLPSLPPTITPVCQQGLSDLPATAFLGNNTPDRPLDTFGRVYTNPNEFTPTGIDHLSGRVPQPSPSTPEASLSSGYTATFLSGFPSQSSLRKIREAAQSKALSVKSPGLSVQVTASSVGDRALHDDHTSTRANTPSDTLSHVPDSTTRKRLSSSSIEEDAGNTSKRQTLVHQSQQTILINNARADFSPTIPDTVSYLEDRSLVPTNALGSSEPGDQLSQWLSKAWQFCATAHYLFITELLSYGNALAGSSSQDQIVSCHVGCTLALLVHCTKQKLAEESDSMNTDCTIDTELRALLRWLHVLQPGADMDLFPELLQLSVLSHRLLYGFQTKKNYDLLATRFQQQKAKIVSQACMRYGAKLLQNSPSNTVSMMLREVQRSQI